MRGKRRGPLSACSTTAETTISGRKQIQRGLRISYNYHRRNRCSRCSRYRGHYGHCLYGISTVTVGRRILVVVLVLVVHCLAGRSPSEAFAFTNTKPGLARSEKPGFVAAAPAVAAKSTSTSTTTTQKENETQKPSGTKRHQHTGRIHVGTVSVTPTTTNPTNPTTAATSPAMRTSAHAPALPALTQDLVDLANLRFNEWVANDNTNDNGNGNGNDNDNTNGNENTNENTNDNTNQSHSQPQPQQPKKKSISRHAFCMATAEIAAERSQAGAVVFLAKWQRPARSGTKNGTTTRRWTTGTRRGTTTSSSSAGTILQRHDSSIPVGSAELSPIEFEGALVSLDDNNNTRNRWYVTDVVTSSQHRRMGVANQLMDAVERYAFYHHHHHQKQQQQQQRTTNKNVTTTTTLYLHVKEGNDAAVAFYQNPKRGYSIPTVDELEGIDCYKLAANAGIHNEKENKQILLCKTLTNDNLPKQEEPPLLYDNDDNDDDDDDKDTIKTTTATASAAGFGSRSGAAKNKQKKKRKRTTTATKRKRKR